jgi:PAS domain S-box-containing protein
VLGLQAGAYNSSMRVEREAATAPTSLATAADAPDVLRRAGFEAYLLDQVQAAVIAADLGGTVTHWNRHAEILFGWSKDEAVGRMSTQLLVPEDVLGTGAELTRLARGGRAWEGEAPVRRRDGGTVLCYVTDSPIRDAAGNVVGAVSVAVDITERKRQERLLVARTTATGVLSQASSLEEAAPQLLRAVCENTGWRFGAMWRTDPPEGAITCVAVWPESDEGEFGRSTRHLTLGLGEGLPGRVWASGAPLWIPDIAADDNFPRARVAAQQGLHAACGFPIALGVDLLGVIEFFSQEILEPDGPLLQTIGVIGSQIGQFMERKQAQDELTQSRDQLEAIFQSVTEGITVQDPSGRVIFANEAAARISGYPSAQAMRDTPVHELLTRFEIMDEEGQPFPLERLPGRLALEGQAGPEVVLCFRNRESGEVRWSSVRASPVPDDRGEPRFAVNIFRDVTERKRARDLERFLGEATALLAGSLHYRQTLQRLAGLAVPELADWCSVEMLEEDGSSSQLAVAPVYPAKGRWARELGKRYPADPASGVGVHEVIRTGRSKLYTEIGDEVLAGAAVDQEHLVLLRALGMRSAMSVPLSARGGTLGAITFISAESGRVYTQTDLAAAEELGRRAGMAVDNARLYEEKSRVAQALQRSLLPPQLPEIRGVELGKTYLAAGRGNQVGGDFYDVFDLGDRTWALVVGDVCGKGPDAAAVTGLARHTIRAAAMQERKPSRILSSLNDAVLQQRSDHIFCTVALARLRPNEHGARLTICCGGHPLPLILRAAGTVETAGKPGTLLGIFPETELWDRAVDLSPGDAIVFYTDGVVEEHGEGDELFGRERLIALLGECAGRSAAGIAESIERAVLSFRPEAPRDDMAILVARVRPPDEAGR